MNRDLYVVDMRYHIHRNFCFIPGHRSLTSFIDPWCMVGVVLAMVPDCHIRSGSGFNSNHCQSGGPGCQ